MKSNYINTVWEVWTYDVWGNEKDGFEVNDRSCLHREYPMRIKVEVNNQGTGQEFLSAYPTDKQVRQALDLKRIQIDTDGDDLTFYVNHASTGYPCGELHCMSHTSLAPIEKG